MSETSGSQEICPDPSAETDTAEPGCLSLELEADPAINFAMQQNDVPVVKMIRAKNESDQVVRDIELRVWSEPPFLAPFSCQIAAIDPGSTYNVTNPKLDLSAQFLLDLTERMGGNLRVEACCNGTCMANMSDKIDLLAPDQWSGLRSLPELLAAFVLPNHPAIENILASAATVLQGWTGDSSLSGYQTKSPDRVLKTTGAIFTALHNLGLSYVNPPASFEQEGQKIRLPHRVLENRMGTCIDLAVLMAACLEQSGLHPLIVILEGHAFVGVWLTEECFQNSAEFDVSAVRKRVDLGELCVIEATLLANTEGTFERARTEARAKLERDEEFLCAVDIKRARKAQIRPLPLKAEGGQVQIAIGERRPRDGQAESAPEYQGTTDRIRVDGERDPNADETPATRLDRWKRKLLDLTLHNRLINFKDSKKSIPILCPDLPALEDALADGKEFTIGPKPAEMTGGPRNADVHLDRTGQDLFNVLLTEEFKAHRLHADLAPAELDHRLIEIFRASRGAIEESGFNPLYLAIGFLQWYESPSSDQPHMAPILLIPLELARKMVREGFRIRQGDDEPMINITLLELLERDYGIHVEGLDPLPTDGHGIDVRHILTVIRRAVLNIPRWDIIERAQIGLFTFTKHLMWRDLQVRSSELMNNKIVEHLVNRPNDPYPSAGTFPDKDRLDETHRLETTYSPLSADSSQMAAIYAGAEGKSFVLDGPPGTGKSQTITNLIAQALTSGKSVLFVSEKMAALDVVFSRLKRIGLEHFCLELHSNKSHKKDVIDQLGQALEKTQLHEPETWNNVASRLEETRRALNQYPEAMHRKQKTGESIYEGLSKLIGLKDAPHIQIKWNSPDEIDREKVEDLRELVEKIGNAGDMCGHPSGHAWAAAGCDSWSPGFQREAQDAINVLKAKLQPVENAAATAGPYVGMKGGAISLAGYEFVAEIAALLINSPGPTAALLTEADWEAADQAIGEWIRRGRLRDTLREKLYGRYSEGILKLDLEGLAARLEQANSAWGPIGWFKRLPVRSALKKVSRPGQKPRAEKLADDLRDAHALRAEEDALSKAGDRARNLLGRYWQDGQADWSALEELTVWAGMFRKLTSKVGGGDLNKAAQYRQQLARLLTEGREQLAPAGPIGCAFAVYLSAWGEFQEARRMLEQMLSLDAEKACGNPAEADAMSRIGRRLDDWLGHMVELQSWCHWRATRRSAVDQNMLALIDAYENQPLQSNQLRAVFDHAFYEWWVETLFNADPVLKSFYAPEHEQKIQRFRKMDEEFLRLTIELVQARLAAKIPVTGDDLANENSEMGILQRQLQRQRNHMSIRKLFQKIPNLLPRLKPCLLMSPISVAQYLDPAHPQFDLVVFDEASQIPVWDAVGAIARGKEAVIVGDPKQLPPTNFFNRSDGEAPEDDDTVEDLESILDDCIAARIPRMELTWHYRSRHEGLIAFSNHSYYKNRLLTFPSAANGAKGVEWRPVLGGIYDAGRSRTNRAEAEAVVEEIIRRLTDSDLSRRSIGVVTFSVAQQELIEDLLDERRCQRPEIEPFFSSDDLECVFVKNLESVQGDERDVIFFSICYGPDAQGRVSMNFGPLNKDGGERRLNVAITRARREVVVFSTLRADQIDLARTRARGVADLKLFLKYAEQGPSAIAEAINHSENGKIESPFEQQVFDALIAKGHTVHTQVGCSGYRIDMAIVDAENPGRYLLGVECDGANYHRARTARDRDRLRESILKGLGWQMHRVWSTDWWRDPAGTLQKIEAAIENAKHAPVHRDQPVQARPIMSAPAQVPKPAQRAVQQNAELIGYEIFQIKGKLGDVDDFHSQAQNAKIQNLIREIVEKEGPISLRLATRRLGESYQISRITERVLARAAQIAQQSAVKMINHDGELFLWPLNILPDAYTGFRIPGDDPETRREAADLPPEEIANAAHYILKRQVSLPEDDLVKETGRLLGYQRTGNQVDPAIRFGIQILIKRNRAREQEGMIIYSNE